VADQCGRSKRTHRIVEEMRSDRELGGWIITGFGLILNKTRSYWESSVEECYDLICISMAPLGM
jgi:hypothetical protein